MLLSFKVKNFRSIKDEITLDLRATSDKTMKSDIVFESAKESLLKSVAIYGPNASGKSNLLKSFFVFRMMVLESLLRNNLATDLPSEYFKLSLETENKPSSFEISFLLDGEVFNYGFEMDKKKIHKEWLKQEKGKKNLFIREGQDFKNSNKNYFREATEALKNNTSERVLFLSVLSSNNKPISKKIVEFIKNTNLIIGTNNSNILNYSFDQFLNNPSMAKKMKDFVLKADFGVTNIEASEKMIPAKQIQNMPDKFKESFFREDYKIAERNINFLHKKLGNNEEELKSEPFDFFNEESSGTQNMFILSAPLIDTLDNGKILFIDEIDTSLHPIICQYLISIFNSKDKNPKNAQLIFTTHDISLMNEDFLRRDQIYFTDKNKKGSTELFSLSDISERKGVAIAKRYLEGRYSSLPYISDFEDIKFSK